MFRKQKLILFPLLALMVTASPTPGFSEEDCRLSLHIAKYTGKPKNAPEITGVYSELAIFNAPFLTRFDYSSVSVGKGEKRRVLYLHLTKEGSNNFGKASAANIGMRMAAVYGDGEKNRIVSVIRVVKAETPSQVGLLMKSSAEAAKLAACINKRIGGEEKKGTKEDYEF